MIIKSNNIYSPQNYLELVTGICYYFQVNKPILEQMTSILKHHKLPAESYLITETPNMLKKGMPVVLVDCCDVKENSGALHEYRWFRVSENFKD